MPGPHARAIFIVGQRLRLAHPDVPDIPAKYLSWPDEEHRLDRQEWNCPFRQEAMSRSFADHLSRRIFLLNPSRPARHKHPKHQDSLGLIRWELLQSLSFRRIILLLTLSLLVLAMGGFTNLVPLVVAVHLSGTVFAWRLTRKPSNHRLVFFIGTLLDPVFIAVLFWAVGPDPLIRITIYCFIFALLANTVPVLSARISTLTCISSLASFSVVATLTGIPSQYTLLGSTKLALGGYGNFVTIKAMIRAYRGTMHYYSSLKSRREKLAKSSREKADFLANMNHELRTPLNGIIGMTGLLLASPLPPEQEEYARTIRSSAELLLALINDILDMSRADAGQLQIEHRAFELEPAITLVSDNLKASARDKGISLSVVYATAIPPVMIGDPTRINQILFNLVGNAIKFTHFGRVCITVSVHPSPEDPAGSLQMLRLAVSDTGIGIPHSQLENIFDKYRQASVDMFRKFGGTGLGLAITRELVHRMNGTITVTSEVGKGSVFTATIPCVIPESGAPLPVPEALPARISHSTILLADDNPVNLSLLGRMTRNFGCQTREVRDGDEALEALKQMAVMGKIDLAILDYQMPGLNGQEVVRELRDWENTHHYQPVPVVILTGHLGTMLEPDFRTISAVEIVEKPVRLHQLKSIVDKYLGNPVARPDPMTHFHPP